MRCKSLGKSAGKINRTVERLGKKLHFSAGDIFATYFKKSKNRYIQVPKTPENLQDFYLIFILFFSLFSRVFLLTTIFERSPVGSYSSLKVKNSVK